MGTTNTGLFLCLVNSATGFVVGMVQSLVGATCNFNGWTKTRVWVLLLRPF